MRPILYAPLLNALDGYLNPATIFILRGKEQPMNAWRRNVFQHYLPDVLCFTIAEDVELPPELEDKKMITNEVCAYICEDLCCLQPVTELDQFQRFINKMRNKNPSRPA